VPTAKRAGAAVVFGPGAGRLLAAWLVLDELFGAFLSFPAAGPRAAVFVDRQRLRKETKRRLGGRSRAGRRAARRGAGALIGWLTARPNARAARLRFGRKPPARPAASMRG